jgi:hypothetical protein
MSNMNRVQLMLKRQGRSRPVREPFEVHRTSPSRGNGLSTGESGRGPRPLQVTGKPSPQGRPETPDIAGGDVSTVTSSAAFSLFDPD